MTRASYITKIARWFGALLRPFAPLATDRRGNVLIMTAVLMMPLIALVGSAIDIARYQVAKARLQSACDAGVLAGRRAMTGGTVDDAVKAETRRFFNFNFPQRSFDTAAFTPSVTNVAGSNQTVALTATTTIPMTLMRLFTFTTMTMSVTCNAKQDFVNTDIILVLDTTGSMNDPAPGSSQKKIDALEDAVLAFYDQLKPVQDQLAAASLRLRYGIVPYSSAVNIGKVIRGLSTNNVASDEWTYQTRENKYDSITVLGYTYRYNYRLEYAPRSIDISSYVAGNTVDVTPIIGNRDDKDRNSTEPQLSTWQGCVEERQTVRMAADARSIPVGANDLNIDLKPTNDESRWKPYWPEVVFNPDKKSQPQVACPYEAARLKVWDRASLKTYLGKLTTTGGTYHDNGMMWGARMGSPNGIFGTDNPETFGGLPVKRYILFMTDGVFDTGYDSLYSSYGIEKYDARVTSGGNNSNETEQLGRHQNRFNLLCSKAKSMGYQVWVLVFDATLNNSLTNCASSADMASRSANAAQLNAKFVEIGKNIGSLRLSR